MVRLCSIFENCNLLIKNQIALELCNLGDDMGMAKEDPDLNRPKSIPTEISGARLKIIYNWRRNKMEEDKYYRFITDDCAPNCIALCINLTCLSTMATFKFAYSR